VARSPVFVVTTGRTGSTLLSNMLKNHPEICSLSEVLASLTSRALSDRVLDGTAFLGRLTSPSPILRAMYRNGIRQGEVLYEQGRHGDLPLSEVPPLALVTLPFLDERPLEILDEVAPLLRRRGRAPLASHMRFLFDWLAKRFGKARWVERSGDSLLFVERLAAMFPDARFVHLYRDGRDVALSMSGHSDFRSKVFYYRLMGRLGIDMFRSGQAYGIAPWHGWFEAVLVKVLPIRAFVDADVDAKACARHWDREVQSGLSMLAALDPDRVHHVAYERLVQEPDKALREIMRFIGTDAPDDWLVSAAALAEVREQKWRRLPAERIGPLEEACGDSLKNLGYV
jgi:putative sulfotransferase